MFRSAFTFLAAAVLASVLAAPARANMIVNGDFETGNLTGWTQGGNTYASGVGNLFHTGQYGYEMGPPTTTGSLTQTITTTPGNTYYFSFWVKNMSAGSNEFTAYWDNTPLVSYQDAGLFYFTYHTFTVTAQDVTTDIQFVYRHDTDFYGLDDVSVVPAPEPSSLTLVLLAVAGVWLIKRQGGI